MSIALLAIGVAIACGGDGRQGGGQSVVAPSPNPSPSPTPPPSPNTGAIATDSALFTLVTETEPFGSYALFPKADPINFGSLAHQPSDRVRLNATAFAALQNERLPSGTRFPDGSVIFKEILSSAGTVTLYSVMYKDSGNPLAANDWLWAEFSPGGTVAFSINSRGSACTACHSQGRGSTNDFVRTFERQRS